MEKIFEIKDKEGRLLYLSKERLKHIQKHPHMHDPIENIKLVLNNPTAIRYNEEEYKVIYYYKEFKDKEPRERYLLVSVKYLNGNGFIVTSFFTNKITGIKWKKK